MPLPDELRLIADLRALPGHETAVRGALQRLVGPSRAEAGCLQYDLHEDRAEPGHFMFFERWADAAALDAHTRTPHYLAAGPQLEGLVAGPTTLTQFKQIS